MQPVTRKKLRSMKIYDLWRSLITIFAIVLWWVLTALFSLYLCVPMGEWGSVKGSEVNLTTFNLIHQQTVLSCRVSRRTFLLHLQTKDCTLQYKQTANHINNNMNNKTLRQFSSLNQDNGLNDERCMNRQKNRSHRFRLSEKVLRKVWTDGQCWG